MRDDRSRPLDHAAAGRLDALRATMSYPRENIAAVDLDRMIVWGQRYARPCGCRMQIGLPVGSTNLKGDAQVGLTPCADHDAEIERVLHTMKTMPPSDEDLAELFARLLEEEIERREEER